MATSYYRVTGGGQTVYVYAENKPSAAVRGAFEILSQTGKQPKSVKVKNRFRKGKETTHKISGNVYSGGMRSNPRESGLANVWSKSFHKLVRTSGYDFDVYLLLVLWEHEFPMGDTFGSVSLISSNKPMKNFGEATALIEKGETTHLMSSEYNTFLAAKGQYKLITSWKKAMAWASRQ